MSDRESVREQIATWLIFEVRALTDEGLEPLSKGDFDVLAGSIEAALRAAGRRALITPTLDMETFDTECVRAGIAALRGETHE